MATVLRKGQPVETIGDLPNQGDKAPDFTLVKSDLSEVNLSDYKGKRVVLNIFPSIDTPTCAMSVREFNQCAVSIKGVSVVCVSADLPFALDRFCGAEGIDNVETVSCFRSSFGDDYGVTFTTGALKGLLSRSVVVISENGQVLYTEQVPDTSQQPDYSGVLSILG